MNRSEHLAWCKERALEYVDAGDLSGAVASMASDLGKHEETRPSQTLIVLAVHDVAAGDAHRVREFINGFN